MSNKVKRLLKVYATISVAGLIIIILAVSLGGSSKPNTNSKQTAAKTTSSKSTATSTTPSSSITSTSQSNKPVLTGFGSTQAEWNKTHTMDTKFATDSAYNPEPNSAGGCNGTEYCSMTGTTNYEMSFPNGQSQAATQAIVMKEFPSDTTVLWQQKMTNFSPDVCYQMEVTSPTLDKALGDSEAFVEFQTFDPNNSTGNIEYNANNVNQATLSEMNYASPSDSTGC